MFMYQLCIWHIGPVDRGGSATVEQEGRGKTPPFTVTRHTPRARTNVRLRTHSVDSNEATLRAEKKIKIEAGENVKSKKKGVGAGEGKALKSEFWDAGCTSGDFFVFQIL